MSRTYRIELLSILVAVGLGVTCHAKAQELDRQADYVVPITIVLDLDNPNRLTQLQQELVQSRTDLANARTASELRAIQEHRRVIKLEILRLSRLAKK